MQATRLAPCTVLYISNSINSTQSHVNINQYIYPLLTTYTHPPTN